MNELEMMLPWVIYSWSQNSVTYNIVEGYPRPFVSTWHTGLYDPEDPSTAYVTAYSRLWRSTFVLAMISDRAFFEALL